MPRAAGVYRQIRNLGPNFHPMVEVTLAGTGWASWVAAGNGTWFEAGVEMRRRITFLLPDLGETWLLNEFDRTTRIDGARTQAEIDHGLTVPYTRAAMKEPARPRPVRGRSRMATLPAQSRSASRSGTRTFRTSSATRPSSSRTSRTPASEPCGQGALAAARGLRGHAEPRRPGAPWRNDEYLEDYVFHLREAGARRRHTTTVDRFLNDTFVPFINGGGYVGLGGDAFDFVTGHGKSPRSRSIR